MVNIAVNGIGRIGKFVLKFLIERNANVVCINDSVGDIELHRHLLEFDSVHGRWNAKFSYSNNTLTINNKKIIFTKFKEIEDLELDNAVSYTHLTLPTTPYV